MQTLGLDRLLHKIRLGHNGRDGQPHRHRHAAQRLRILRRPEPFVPVAHVARVEVGIRSRGREIEGVDAGFGEHEEADPGRFVPDAVQVRPGRVPRRAVREERGEQVPGLVDAGQDVAFLHPEVETFGLRHVGDGFGAGEEESSSHVGWDRAEELAAVARDAAVVVGGEAAEEQGPEGEVDDELVDDACDEQGARFAAA